jgi:hypothetical protein
MNGIKQFRSMSKQSRDARPYIMALGWFAFSLPILASGRMLLWSTATRALESRQSNAIASATSPDGRFTATLGAVTFGGVSLEGMSLVIHKNGSNESLAVFELTETNEGQIQWEGSAKVTVFIPAGSKMTWHGTVIGYPEVYVTTLHPK